MLEYILKRLLWFIPTLFLVSLLGFGLLVYAPGDPTDLLASPLQSKSTADPELRKEYWRKQLGLDLPTFYLSVATLAEPDTLYRIRDKSLLNAYKQLLSHSGNADAVSGYFEAIQMSRKLLRSYVLRIFQKDTGIVYRQLRPHILQAEASLSALETASDTIRQDFHLKAIRGSMRAFPADAPDLAAPVLKSLQKLQQDRTVYKNFVPKIIWYGSRNRYHQWLFGGSLSKGLVRGDFGISYISRQPVGAIIKDKMLWSLFFSLASIFLAYLVSVPIGLWLARKPHQLLSRLMQFLLFLLYAMPVFFAGVLLLMLFANPDVLPLFPPSGVKPIGGYSPDAGFFGKLFESLPYLVLPLACYTYASLAYISRLTQTSVGEQLSLDYIRTARAKGLDEKAIVWKHALKNSLLPLITVFSAIFPSVIGGSVIIENIFTIPGMGLETVKAIVSRDYPVVIAVLTLSCMLTMLSYLLADILYAWADPRIRYKS